MDTRCNAWATELNVGCGRHEVGRQSDAKERKPGWFPLITQLGAGLGLAPVFWFV